MLFRPPLRIDYSARAQDLIALERENRKATCRIVPRVPPGDDTDVVASDGGPSSSRETAEGNERRREPETDRNGTISERPTGRMQSLMRTLGPAIAPSEDALRDVEKVTRGPIRGSRLPVKSESVAVLLGIGGVETVSNLKEVALDTVTSSPSTGKHRIGGDLLHADTGIGLAGEYEGLQSQVWAQHAAAIITACESLYLHHDQDDDLDTLGRWQSARTVLHGSDFARMVSYRPELARAETHGEDNLIRLPRWNANLVADLVRACEQPVETSATDYESRLYNVPLAEFLDTDGESQAGVKLPALEQQDFSIIRLDPTLEPVEVNEERVMPTARMLRTVGEVYSAALVMKQIRHPHIIRPKENDPKRMSFPVRRPQYAFLDFASLDNDGGRGSLEVDPMGCFSSNPPAFPRKITLDRDISLDIQPESMDEPRFVSPSLLPTFTSTLSFGGKKHISCDRPRLIPSVRGVGSVDALAGVVGASSATCLFIPKPKIPSRRSEVEDMKRDDEVKQREAHNALISALRSCVPTFTGAPGDMELLQRQCEQYPLKSWFRCDTEPDEPNEPVQDDSLQIKRKAFCLHAKSKSNVEHARTCLITGSNSKRTLSGRYIYKSFLTNDKIEPKVFQRRYLAMLVMRRQTDPDGSCQSMSTEPNDYYFVRTAMNSFAEAFARKRTLVPGKKSAKAGKRGAALPIKTKRHGIIKMSSKKEPTVSNTEPASEDGGEVFGTSLVEAVLSAYQGEAESSRDVSMDSLIKVVEEDSLRIRGELLHLSDKAQELSGKINDDEPAMKRGRVNTPPPPSSGESCEPVASAGEKRKVEEAIDLTLDDDDEFEKTKSKKEKKRQALVVNLYT